MKIGKILLSANLISQEALREALTISRELKQPLGKVLTSTQQVSDQALQSALLAQSMVSQGLVEEDVAITTLKLAVEENVPFGQALSVITQSPNQLNLTAELEEILVQSGMVSPQVMEEAKKRTSNTSPLGSTLMSMHAIVFAHLNYAFECITLIEQGRLSKENAIKALADIKKENIALNTALKKQRIATKKTRWTLKLGDLLTAGTVISEKDNLNAIEMALTEKRLVGDILVKSNLITSDVLRNALELQAFVTKGVISKDEAALVLRQVVSKNEPVDKVLRDRKSFKDDPETSGMALELLISAGCVNKDLIPNVMAEHERYQMDALKALVASDEISAEVCRAAVECAQRLSANAITMQSAIQVVDHCDRLQTDVEQALTELALMPQNEKQQPSKWSGKYEAHSKSAAPAQTLSWSKSIEFKLAIVAVVLGVAGLGVALYLNPNQMAGPFVCGVLLIVGIAFFLLGRIWQMRVNESKQELEKREEAAKQQVNRLSKFKSKENN